MPSEAEVASIDFNNVVRCICKWLIYTSERDIIFYIGSKPGDILIEEVRHLL